MLYRVARRTALSGMPTTFLILTDHDRAGYNMTDHVEREMRRLVELICDQLRLEVPPLEFVRVGLTAEQVDRYRMDQQSEAVRACRHGNYVANPVHVDALRSAQIEEIVREGIEAQLDMRLLRRTRRQERRHQATLRRELGGRGMSEMITDWESQEKLTPSLCSGRPDRAGQNERRRPRVVGSGRLLGKRWIQARLHQILWGRNGSAV